MTSPPAPTHAGGGPLSAPPPLHFTGGAGEYFRIWIVNAALTVVTLGVYGAWAKVRTRQYFYGHTWLDGQNFAYTANPTAILKGHLVVGAMFLLYVASQYAGQVDERWGWLTVALVALFGLLLPYLIFKSLRFLATNSVHRGLRFHFHGTLRGAYSTHLWWPLLSPFTLGAVFPYVVSLQRRYQMDHAAYGSARARFTGDAGPVYLIYLTALGLTVAGYVALLTVGVALLVPLTLGGARGGGVGAVPWLLAPLYLLYLMLVTGVTQGVRGALLNYTLNHTVLDERVRFEARVNPWLFGWIQLSNVALQVLSVGLATPWAAVRRARYLLAHIAVLAPGGLEDFSADTGTRDGALGESATEFFGIEIGL